MEYSRIKVLMLGWEFPPIVTGGLGAASYGLAKALSSFVDLTIVLPKSDASVTVKKVNVIGLNHFIYDETSNELILHNAKKFSRKKPPMNMVQMSCDPTSILRRPKSSFHY